MIDTLFNNPRVGIIQPEGHDIKPYNHTNNPSLESWHIWTKFSPLIKSKIMIYHNFPNLNKEFNLGFSSTTHYHYEPSYEKIRPKTCTLSMNKNKIQSIHHLSTCHSQMVTKLVQTFINHQDIKLETLICDEKLIKYD